MLSVLAAAIAILCLSGVILLLRKPQFTIVLLMMTFLIEQTLQSYFPILVGGLGFVTNVAIGTLALVAVGNRYMQGRQLTGGYFNAAFTALIILYIFGWMNSFFSPSSEQALGMNMVGWPYWILLIGLAPLLLGDIGEFRRVVIAFMVVGIIVTLFLTLNPAASYEGTGRFRVELEGMERRSNPLALGTAGGMLLICAVLFRPERANLWMTIVRCVAFAMGLGLAIASGSRGQVMVAVAICVLMFPLAYPVRNILQFFAVMTGLAIVLGAVMLVFDAVTTEETIARWDSGSMGEALNTRFENALVLTKEYLSSPDKWLFGLGSNAFTSLGVGDQPYAHNQLVEICTEQGLVGTVLLTIILVTMFKSSRRMFRVYREDPLMRPAVATLIALTAYQMGLALKQGSFLGAPGVFFWIILLTKVAMHESRMADAEERVWLEEQMYYDELEEDEYAGLEQPA
jgi:hypothetical protein